MQPWAEVGGECENCRFLVMSLEGTERHLCPETQPTALTEQSSSTELSGTCVWEQLCGEDDLNCKHTSTFAYETTVNAHSHACPLNGEWSSEAGVSPGDGGEVSLESGQAHWEAVWPRSQICGWKLGVQWLPFRSMGSVDGGVF